MPTTPMEVQMELTDTDKHYVAQRIPRDIRELLATHGGRLFVGGGFIRATIAGETPSDIDLFGNDKDWLLSVAHSLVAVRPDARLHKTDNAITVITPNRLPIQFITRWTFGDAAALIASFDFTVCQAAIWRAKGARGRWSSAVGERFYTDLAARRLFYASPVRDEDAGGSMLRVIKYVKRGYSIQVKSLGAVIARLVGSVNEERLSPALGDTREKRVAGVLTGLLREVDPLTVIDGFEVVDEHAPAEGEGE